MATDVVGREDADDTVHVVDSILMEADARNVRHQLVRVPQARQADEQDKDTAHGGLGAIPGTQRDAARRR